MHTKANKLVTPGYKAVLISESNFKTLQILQRQSGSPIRLSVADLADAAIALQITDEQKLLSKAKEIVISSLSAPSIKQNGNHEN
jgi:hypothetical protein